MSKLVDDLSRLDLVSAHAPLGYLTAESLEVLWNQRTEEADRYRLTNPNDFPGIERRQRRAAGVMQAYRLLTAMEQHLGLALALPVLGARPPDDRDATSSRVSDIESLD